MTRTRGLLTLLCLLATLPSLAAGVEDRSTLDARWRSGAWAARAADLRAQAQAEPARFREAIRRELAAPAPDTAMQERLLQEAMLSMLPIARDPAGRDLLHTVGLRTPRAMTLQDEGGRQLPIPYADPGAAARAVLDTWDRFDSRDRSLAAMIHGGDALAPLEDASVRRELSVRGIELAFGSAPVPQLLTQRERVRGALTLRPRELTGIAATLALRSGDTVLAREVIERGAGRARLDLVLAARSAFAADDATALLIAATAAQDVASAAVLQLGNAMSASPSAREHLLSLLGDAALGGSAAQALAADTDASTLSALSAILARGVDDLSTRRAILTLRLNGGSAASALLTRYLDDPRAPAALRQEVATWIGA